MEAHWLAVMKSLILLVAVSLAVAYLIYGERKMWAAIHLRRGPNVVGPWGLLQPFADFLKFLLKEPLIPDHVNKVIFVLAPFITAVLAFAGFAVIPFMDGWQIADINVGVLYILAISSLHVLGILMAGWSSNSKYPFLASVRVAAQMISYEVSIGFVLVTVVLCASSLNMQDIVVAQDTRFGAIGWFGFRLFPMFVIFFISALAEMHRSPFDLIEAESELVAGHTTEYGSSMFLLFFFAEYIGLAFMCSLMTVLFLGGWLPPVHAELLSWVPGMGWFLLKALILYLACSFVKAFVPRYRFDQLMRLGWKVFLPMSLIGVVATAGVLQFMQ